MASQLVYILSQFPANQAALGEIDKQHVLQLSLEWKGGGGGKDKIKRDVMISDYKNGGL